MESTEVVEQNDSSNDANESDLNSVRSEVSSASIYGKGLEPPILGSSYRAPDILKKYIEPIVLDTSLPYIPIYTHLKTHDLKPIERPLTPPILSELRSKCQNDAESCKSSRASLSTGTMSKGMKATKEL
ncbi:WD repeat-containing protein on Y chromosome [Frieseomelitta varia]|uniref:WD repeat-containing protein on Y chromosome n=1 Tax=Frieseomelitta varia TaxID=561572 RepID=UPI001CB69F75|nr:WD repeat-containing protein on Y chromosome [Frieseomelitta varia]